jgi:anti-sigma B factor antagonist
VVAAASYSAAPREAQSVTVVPLGPIIIVGNRLLARSILEQTFRDRGGVIVADLSGVVYVDASGLGALVSARKTIRRDGGDVELAGLPDEIRTLFELTRLDTLFRIHDRAPEPVA